MQAKNLFVAVIFLTGLTFSPECFAHGPHDVSGVPWVDGSYDGDEYVPTPTDGGVREEIPEKYRERFDRWKLELMSTEFGRNLWDRFAKDRSFVLRIVMSEKERRGGWVGAYQRDHLGKLVGATITIGHKLGEGYPAARYYPVLSSLNLARSGGPLLAAAKLAHELGHVSDTADADFRSIQLRDHLTRLYNQRLLVLGFSERDNILVGLARQMGGTPAQISERGEYASEVFTYRYIESRIDEKKNLCRIVRQVRQNLKDESPGYISFFDSHLIRANCDRPTG